MAIGCMHLMKEKKLNKKKQHDSRSLSTYHKSLVRYAKQVTLGYVGLGCGSVYCRSLRALRALVGEGRALGNR